MTLLLIVLILLSAAAGGFLGDLLSLAGAAIAVSIGVGALAGAALVWWIHRWLNTR